MHPIDSQYIEYAVYKKSTVHQFIGLETMVSLHKTIDALKNLIQNSREETWMTILTFIGFLIIVSGITYVLSAIVI